MIEFPTTPAGKPKKALGILWYNTQEDFEAMKALCPDFVDEDFATWQVAAAEALEAEGKPKVPVPVKVEAFEKWCKAAGVEPRVEARQRFVHDIVEESFTQALKKWKKAKRR